jgi:hypothetical protein
MTELLPFRQAPLGLLVALPRELARLCRSSHRRVRPTLFLAVLLGVSTALAQTGPQMYAFDGANLVPIFNPNGISCDHWTMLLFGDGVPAVFGQQWGAIDGTSAGDVQNKWQQTRDANARANAFLHVYGAQSMGYEVHMGPICILQTPSPRQKEDLTQADALFNKILATTYAILNQLNKATGFVTPTDAQFVSNLNLIRQRVDSIRNYLNTNNRANLSSIEAALQEANVSAQKLIAQHPSSGESHPATAAGGTTGGQSWNGKMFINQNGQAEGVAILSASSLRFTYSVEGNMGSGAAQSVQTDLQIAWVNRVILEGQFVTVACDRTLQAQPVAGGAAFPFNYYVRIQFTNLQDAQNFAAYVKSGAGLQ